MSNTMPVLAATSQSFSPDALAPGVRGVTPRVLGDVLAIARSARGNGVGSC